MNPSQTKVAVLGLVVLRSENIEELAAFYGSLLQVGFEQHCHGKGPEHMGTELNGLIFEIYPKRNEHDSTTAIRLGFKVGDIGKALARINGQRADSPREAVAEDPRGARR